MHKQGFKSVFLRELRLLGREKLFSLSVIFIPIITFLLLITIFYSGIPHNMSIAVVDSDNSSLSRQLTQMIDATQSVAVKYSVSSLSEGREMMYRGEIDAVVVIPNSFEKDILKGEKTSCDAFINGVNILVGSLIERDISTTVQTFSTGIEIQKLVAKGNSSEQAYNLAMPITFDKHILFNPYTNYAYYLLPGFMPMMLLLVVLLSSAFSIGIELKEKSAYEWYSSSGDNILVAVTAKLLPYTMIFLFHMAIMNIMLYGLLKVPLNGSVGILVAANILFLLAYQWLGVFITAILSNMRLSMSVCAGYGVMAFSFSGLTFPYLAMSEPIAILGNLFPMSFYIKLFIDQAMRGAPHYISLIDLAALIGFILISLLSLPRLRKIATNCKYWGKE